MLFCVLSRLFLLIYVNSALEFVYITTIIDSFFRFMQKILYASAGIGVKKPCARKTPLYFRLIVYAVGCSALEAICTLVVILCLFLKRKAK